MHFGIDNKYMLISENTGKLNNSSNISPVYLKIPVAAAKKCGILRFLIQQAANEIHFHEKCIWKTVQVKSFQLNCIIYCVNLENKRTLLVSHSIDNLFEWIGSSFPTLWIIVKSLSILCQHKIIRGIASGRCGDVTPQHLVILLVNVDSMIFVGK